MEESRTFLDELLEEEELKEEERTEAYYDLVLLQIKTLQHHISLNFREAEKEIQLINNFVLKRNSLLDERIKFLERKLESFIREKSVKTLEMPNGILKLHKKQDKIEIEDVQLFLKHAKPEMLTVIPETIKPDLNKIKIYLKSHLIPKGIKVIKGSEEFTYKIREESEVKDAREKEARAGAKQDSCLRAVV